LFVGSQKQICIYTEYAEYTGARHTEYADYRFQHLREAVWGKVEGISRRGKLEGASRRGQAGGGKPEAKLRLYGGGTVKARLDHALPLSL